MNQDRSIPGWKDKVLFTPGPLTTSRTVKQAMLRDLGSRDFEFIDTVRDIRRRLLALGGVGSPGYEAVLMQGSGTFGIESVLGSAVPADGGLAVLVNGAYGRRMVQMAGILGIPHQAVEFRESEPIRVDRVRELVEGWPELSHVAMVHCETTTGLMNPLEGIGQVVAGRGKRFIVDAMSSFGAVPIDLAACCIDYLISSANKCIEGVPGFSFVLARREALRECEGRARSLSLDLFAQWQGLESNGQFRFTPPTHALLAFHQALRELEQEGGVMGRAARYLENYQTLILGMRRLGFREYLEEQLQGYIITSFLYPEHPAFDFEEFYRQLNDRGFVIYPGKLSEEDCFRIGHIGRLRKGDLLDLLGAVEDVVSAMGLNDVSNIQ